MIAKCLLLYGALSFLMLANCGPSVESRVVTFNPAEYEPYKGEGTATISGEAVIRTKAGDRRKGAGNTIYLIPVTSYSTEWFQRAVLNGEALATADQREAAYSQQIVANDEGQFAFDKLRPGEYYIVCPITWKAPGYFGYAGGTIERTAGWAHAKVKVAGGEHKKVVLTPSTGKAPKAKARRS